MGRRLVRPFILHRTVLPPALPAIGFAQEATSPDRQGRTTGGVLPGRQVRAVHEATGTQFRKHVH